VAEKLDEIDPETSAYRILCYLAFRDAKAKPQDISNALHENASTVRARLAELKRDGLVDARPDGYVATVKAYDIIMKVYRDLRKEFRS
jgi:predicted transcriptional regulator